VVLVAPNWTLQFPGFSYKGDDPDGFMSKDEVAAFLEQYAQSFKAPLQTGVRVTSLKPNLASDGYLVQTDDTIYEAVNVVIATGRYQLPKIPSRFEISRRRYEKAAGAQDQETQRSYGERIYPPEHRTQLSCSFPRSFERVDCGGVVPAMQQAEPRLSEVRIRTRL
jgi:Pyridine nucleotide-disulphide oxidoreductase